jgi:hypothetical protein
MATGATIGLSTEKIQAIQAILRETCPEVDVKVSLNREFGGVWKWNGSSHHRIPLDELKKEFTGFTSLIDFMRSIPLVKIDL